MTNNEINQVKNNFEQNNDNNYDKNTKLFISPATLALDDYDDIFSDFDPRPYSIRSLSDDFLNESRKATKDNDGKVELLLLIPKNKRSSHQEHIIKKRLREHFSRHAKIEQGVVKKIMTQGLLFVFLGTLIMFFNTYFIFSGLVEKYFVLSFISVWIETPGWFLIWEGLGTMVFKSKTKIPEAEFYTKMSNCDINFMSY